MTPIPLNEALSGGSLPYERGAKGVVAIDIVERDGRLVAEDVWDNGERTPCGWGNSGFVSEEDAWGEAALNENLSRALRRQALDRVIELVHESHEWDCYEG